MLVGGPLHSRKGINLPETNVTVPALTEYDWRCVAWSIEQQLDFLALSFVRTAEEIEETIDHSQFPLGEITSLSTHFKNQS